VDEETHMSRVSRQPVILTTARFGSTAADATAGAQDAAVQESRFGAEKFLSTHAAVYNIFNVQRHLTSAQTHRTLRAAAMDT
jgi:hypothetical protein